MNRCARNMGRGGPPEAERQDYTQKARADAQGRACGEFACGRVQVSWRCAAAKAWQRTGTTPGHELTTQYVWHQTYLAPIAGAFDEVAKSAGRDLYTCARATFFELRRSEAWREKASGAAQSVPAAVRLKTQW